MSILASRRVTGRNKRAYERAKAEAGDTGSVCGFVDDEGMPHYFVVPKDASEEEIRARAFQAKHGRPMNRAEELLGAAQAGDFLRAYEQAMTHYLDRTPVAAD